MDGDGREQNMDPVTPEDDADDAQASTRPEGRGEDRFGGGAFATDRSDKAVENQSIVTSDAYAGSSESGV